MALKQTNEMNARIPKFRIPLRFKLVSIGLIGMVAAAFAVFVCLKEMDASVEKTAQVMATNVAGSMVQQIQFSSTEEGSAENSTSIGAAQKLMEYINRTDRRDAELIDRDLKIVANTDTGRIGQTITKPDMVNVIARTLQDGQSRNLVDQDPETGKPLKQIVVPVHQASDGSISGVLIYEYTPIYDSIKFISDEFRNVFLELLAPVSAILLALILILSDKIVREVRALRAASMSLSQGVFKRSTITPSNDELGDLTIAFDHMVDSLEQSERQLQAEIVRRIEAQSQIQAMNDSLERRVQARTMELTEAKAKLDDELAERKTIEQKLVRLAAYDPLTGLPNRNEFLHRLEAAFGKSKQSGKSIGLIFLDMDRFKSINDSFGHEIGDLVLSEAAQRFRKILGPMDTASRIGGDEFTIIVEGIESKQELQDLAEKLIRGFSAPIMAGSNELHVTVSLGIAMYPSDCSDMEELLKKADLAMYQAKMAGRNGYQFHSEKMSALAQNKLAIEFAMRQGLENNEFRLHYQVRVSAKTNRPVGMEALLRWHSPTLGPVSPVDFIPVAEETGMILELGEWVLRTAIQQYATWQSEGLDPGVLGINVSARQFKQTAFVNQVANIAAEHGVDPKYIELEVTESMLMSDPERATQQMNELRSLGFGIAIDDFGTGFSGLSNLKNFPATKIKIDRTFITNIDEKNEDAAIATAIVALAASLNMQVTAEGVETQSQMTRLKDMSCNEYQGFFFSEPLPANSMSNVLSRGLHYRGKEKLEADVRKIEKALKRKAS